jgi:hypothetical protein
VNSTDWLAVAGIAGFLIFVAMLLLYLFVRDVPLARFRRYRVGVFVEEDRHFVTDEPPWPDIEQTAELPPIREDT